MAAFRSSRAFELARNAGIAALLLLPAAITATFLHLHGDYPFFDDASYWINAFELGRKWREGGSLAQLYALRDFRGTLIPYLGAPFLAFTGLSPAATAIVMPLLMAFTTFSLYLLFRAAGTERRYATASAAAVSLLPIVFENSLRFYNELPFLGVAALAFALRLQGRIVAAGLFGGLSLCFRLPEGLFLWSLWLLFRAALQIRPLTSPASADAKRSIAGDLAMATLALLVAAAWYFPTENLIAGWLLANLSRANSAKPVPDDDSLANFLITVKTCLPWFAALYLLISLFRNARRREPENLLVLLGAAALFLFQAYYGAYHAERGVRMVHRYFSAAAAFALGSSAWALHASRFRWPAIGLLILAELAVYPRILQQLRASAATNYRQKETCLHIMEPIRKAFDPLGPGKIWVAENTAQPIPRDLCTLALLESGAIATYSSIPGKDFIRQPFKFNIDGIVILPSAIRAGFPPPEAQAKLTAIQIPGLPEPYQAFGIPGPAFYDEICRKLAEEVAADPADRREILAFDAAGAPFPVVECLANIPQISGNWDAAFTAKHLRHMFSRVILFGVTDSGAALKNGGPLAPVWAILQEPGFALKKVTLASRGWSVDAYIAKVEKMPEEKEAPPPASQDISKPPLNAADVQQMLRHEQLCREVNRVLNETRPRDGVLVIEGPGLPETTEMCHHPKLRYNWGIRVFLAEFLHKTSAVLFLGLSPDKFPNPKNRKERIVQEQITEVIRIPGSKRIPVNLRIGEESVAGTMYLLPAP